MFAPVTQEAGHGDESSPDFREMIKRALDMIAASEGGLDMAVTQLAAVMEEVRLRPGISADERLALAFTLAHAAILVARTTINLMNDVLQGEDLEPIDVLDFLHSLEQAVDKLLDGEQEA